MKRHRYAPKNFSLLECLMCELKHVSSRWPECTWCVHTHLRTRHNGPLTNLAGEGETRSFMANTSDLSHAMPRRNRIYASGCIIYDHAVCGFLREMYHAQREAIFYGLFDLHGMDHAAFIRIKIFTVNQLLNYAERLI